LRYLPHLFFLPGSPDVKKFTKQKLQLFSLLKTFQVSIQKSEISGWSAQPFPLQRDDQLNEMFPQVFR